MVEHVPKCKICKTPGIRSERFDAYLCVACDIWIEDPCSDPACQYCAQRPARPVKEEAHD